MTSDDAIVRRINERRTDLYGVLGVSGEASPAQVKRGYMAVALSLHPDKNPSREANEAFKYATRAYEILKDDELRALYNRGGMEAVLQRERGAFSWSLLIMAISTILVRGLMVAAPLRNKGDWSVRDVRVCRKTLLWTATLAVLLGAVAWMMPLNENPRHRSKMISTPGYCMHRSDIITAQRERFEKTASIPEKKVKPTKYWRSKFTNRFSVDSERDLLHADPLCAA
jgi:hypothetical protein